MLLSAVDEGRVPVKDFAADDLFAVAAHGDRGARRRWFASTGATFAGRRPEEKLAEVRRLNNDLRAATGDAKAGRALFTKHCAACHCSTARAAPSART